MTNLFLTNKVRLPKRKSENEEVVKNEENPVDKAVAAANKASDGTKPVKDAVNKNAEKGDSKADKLKKMKIPTKRTLSQRKDNLKWN